MRGRRNTRRGGASRRAGAERAALWLALNLALAVAALTTATAALGLMIAALPYAAADAGEMAVAHSPGTAGGAKDAAAVTTAARPGAAADATGLAADAKDAAGAHSPGTTGGAKSAAADEVRAAPNGTRAATGAATGAAVNAAASASAAPGRPARNPWLADSVYPFGHGDPAQRDALPIAGPLGKSRRLAAEEIDYAPLGPAHFGAYISGPYPDADGRRAIWSNGIDRIVKLDHESWEPLAVYHFPGVRRYDEAEAEESLAKWAKGRSLFGAVVQAFFEARKLRDLSGVYTLLDRDGVYYIANKEGRINAYGDAVPGDPDSAIVKLRSTRLPAEISGLIVGMNMSYDGRLVVATEHGFVVSLARDFTGAVSVRLPHSEGAEQKATAPVGYGWIRNGFAIDEAGGIYLVSQQHVHKVVWTGAALSVRPEDGAWSAPYLNGWGHGSGATPSLMGFGDEDRFVVITDGEAIMNLVLFWRDAIPRDWQAPPGAPSPRIAGMLPVSMGEAGQEIIQSEQSVVVSGYGALVVNNTPRNIPWWVPKQAERLFTGYLGNLVDHQPTGVQKFAWNPVARTLREAWINRAVSSPSSVPVVAEANDRVYLIGARDGLWTLEALDWNTGASDFHWVIGGQRFNPLFSGTLLDQRGRIHFGTLWGRARISPRP